MTTEEEISKISGYVQKAQNISANIQADIQDLTGEKTKISDVARDLKSLADMQVRSYYNSENSKIRQEKMLGTAEKLSDASYKIYQYIKELEEYIDTINSAINNYNSAINAIRQSGRKAADIGFGNCLYWNLPSELNKWVG